MENVDEVPSEVSPKKRRTRRRKAEPTTVELEQQATLANRALRERRQHEHNQLVSRLGELALKCGLAKHDDSTLTDEFLAFAKRLGMVLVCGLLLTGCVPPGVLTNRVTTEEIGRNISADGTQVCITTRMKAEQCFGETSTTCIPGGTNIQKKCEPVTKEGAHK